MHQQFNIQQLYAYLPPRTVQVSAPHKAMLQM
jgi:hypothetical protein